MSEDVVKWLSEIRALKQQLAELQAQKDEAIAREANWRKLYSTEAQQRRTEATLAQQEIEQLKVQLQQSTQPKPFLGTNNPESAAEEIVGLETIDALKTKLVAVIQERDRALEALQTEQENHVQTRKSLTAVIADTIDQLSKQRNRPSATP